MTTTRLVADTDQAVAGIADGATVLIGGFGAAGQPVELIDALRRAGPKELTVVSNNAGNGDYGLAALLAAGQVRKMICSFPRQSDSQVFDELYRAGRIELELVPQGNLAERLRAAGAGIGAFFCPTGVGTPLAEGKEQRIIDGRAYLLEHPIRGDVALISADRADPLGNLVYRKTARNFGPVMATAAAITVVQVNEVVPVGGIDPEQVVTPGIFVDRIVMVGGGLDPVRVPQSGVCATAEPVIRPDSDLIHRPGWGTLACSGPPFVEHLDRGPLERGELAALVARDIPAGAYVNLGIGLPTTVADQLEPGDGVTLHTENGMLGMGPRARGDQIDPDLINAGKVPVLELPGAAYFHQADSFAMMRGGHLDVCVLGAFQVSAAGDLANWHTGESGAIPAVGGAMDLAVGAKRVFVMMSLFTNSGAAKLVPRCDYPLTAVGCVARVFTHHAVFEIGPDGVLVRETYGISFAELQDRLGFAVRRWP